MEPRAPARLLLAKALTAWSRGEDHLADRPESEEGGPLNFGEALHRGQYAVIYKSSLPPDETPCVVKVYD